jgi:hypothetical protein
MFREDPARELRSRATGGRRPTAAGQLSRRLRRAARSHSLASFNENNPHDSQLSTAIHKEKKKQKKKAPADDGSIPSVTFLRELTRRETIRCQGS